MRAALNGKRDRPLPARGVAGGYRDPWDESSGAELRAALDVSEGRLLARCAELGRAWRAEIAEERLQRARERNRTRPGRFTSA